MPSPGGINRRDRITGVFQPAGQRDNLRPYGEIFFKISIWTVCLPIILSNAEILAFTAASGPEAFRELKAWLPPAKNLSRQR